jgi:hypothetical protein
MDWVRITRPLGSGSLLQTNQLRNGRTSSSKPGLLCPI